MKTSIALLMLASSVTAFDTWSSDDGTVGASFTIEYVDADVGL